MMQKLSRRAFTGLTMAAFAPELLAQSAGLRLLRLHSFEIRVTNVARSVAFYQSLFAMPEQARAGDRVCLRVGDGPQHMSIRALQDGEAPAITHITYSVEDFDVERSVDALGAAGFDLIDAPPPSARGIDYALKTWVRHRDGAREVYFADPRGLIVQLCDANWCGAAQCVVAANDAPGLFDLRDINHLTVFLNDGAGANDYYQSLFGLSVQAWQGPQSPVTGIGDGYQFVMYAGPQSSESRPAQIHHACFSMTGFDVEQILAALTQQGLAARGDSPVGPLMHYVSRRMPERGGAPGGTPELYLTDPDGILMQLQDTSYCGGGGYLGNECVGV